jgi:hypothetical protein
MCTIEIWTNQLPNLTALVQMKFAEGISDYYYFRKPILCERARYQASAPLVDISDMRYHARKRHLASFR